MKAYKQIDLTKETRIVMSYAGTLCLLGFFIILSPVFAQEDSVSGNQPKVHIDVKRQYDQNGNLSQYDSVYSWYWSGKGHLPMEYDSLFSQFYFPDFGFRQGQRGLPPLMPYGPENDSTDTLNYSLHDHFFNDEWLDNFDFPDFPGFYNWDGTPDDSLGISFHNFDDMQKYFEDKFGFKNLMPDEDYFKKFDRQHDDFIKRYRKYQEENQKLIEKYFGSPLEKNDSITSPKPDNNTPQKMDNKTGKHGTI
jgi:hypothetical protein